MGGRSCASGTRQILRERVTSAITRIGDRVEDGSHDPGARLARVTRRSDDARLAVRRARAAARSISPIVRKSRERSSVDDPRTMKTTEIHDDRGAPAARTTGTAAARIAPIGAPRRRRALAARRRRRRVRAHPAAARHCSRSASIEFSSAYHDRSVAADAVRAGGRVGSAQGNADRLRDRGRRQPRAARSDAPEPTCRKELWIYKANSQGYPGGGHQLLVLLRELHQVHLQTRARGRSYSRGGGGWDRLDPPGLHPAVRRDRHLREAQAPVRDRPLRRRRHAAPTTRCSGSSRCRARRAARDASPPAASSARTAATSAASSRSGSRSLMVVLSASPAGRSTSAHWNDERAHMQKAADAAALAGAVYMPENPAGSRSSTAKDIAAKNGYPTAGRRHGRRRPGQQPTSSR